MLFRSKSGIRYLAVTKNADSSYNIFVYEDDDNKIYKFNTSDICNPIEVDFRGEIKSATFDSKGYGSKLVTTAGSFSFASLTEKDDEDNSTTITTAYAVNKSSYSMLYKSDGQHRKFQRKGSSAFMADSWVADAIKSKKRQLGFLDEKTATWISAGNQFSAPINNMKNIKLEKVNVSELIYAKDGTGWVTGSK